MSEGPGGQPAGPAAPLAELLGLMAGTPVLLLGLDDQGTVLQAAGTLAARAPLRLGEPLPRATWESLQAGRRTELELEGRRYLLQGSERKGGGLHWAVLQPLAPELTLGRFAQHLVHSLRNSLSSVKLTAQTLARQPALPEREIKRLNIALREIRRMERTLTTASEFARTPGRAWELVALGPLLRETAEALAEELAARGVKLTLVGEQAPCAVEADPVRLRAAVENLLLSSACSMPEGGEVEARLREEDGAPVLTIQDRGPALRPGEGDSLFAPLAVARGGGLDLALASLVARELGGTLTANDRPQGGVELTLRLGKRGGVHGHAAAGR